MERTFVFLKVQESSVEDAKGSVLRLLFAYPNTEFSLSELAAMAGVSKSTASRVVMDLQRDGMAHITDLGIVWRIRAQKASERFRKEKLIYNFSIIHKANLPEFLNEVFETPKAIVLFGSFRKAEDAENSDIDIGVELDSSGETKTIELRAHPKITGQQREGVMALEKVLQRKFSITLFDQKNVDQNLFNSIANGIVLSGFLEVGKKKEKEGEAQDPRLMTEDPKIKAVWTYEGYSYG